MRRQSWTGGVQLGLALALGSGLALGTAPATGTQESGRWQPLSTTARGITGEVSFSADKLTINFASFPISLLRALDAEEIKGTFILDGPPQGTGRLYRMQIPATKRFLNKNTMCGAEDTDWVATYVSGRDLQLAFFSGLAIPKLTAEAVANATNLCGTYSYVR